MGLSASDMVRLWESHTRLEFATKDAEATVATMAPNNYVNHVPVMTGGRGRDEMVEFYGRHFIPKMPADTELRLLARTVGQDRLVDEFVFPFTHDVEMDWMLPGVPPTRRKVEVPMVVVVQFEGDKIAGERIYWDQASVLVQLGLIDPAGLPVVGVGSARKFEDPRLPSNELIRRESGR
jgi:carboxymethylenebutenolidase